MEKIELSAALQNLATQTNIDKVTGVYNGVPANIAKADLASVVAGVMGSPVSNKGLLLEDPSTFSTANKNGIYEINYNSNGMSVDTGLTDGVVKWGVLIHMGGTFASQILVNGVNPLKYFARGRSDTGWKTWQRIDNFGYNTLEELAGGMGIGLKKGYTIEPGGEVDLGVSSAGVYVLTNSDSGNAAMYLVSSYPEGMLSETGSSGNGTRFSTSLTAEGFVGFGRKATNGNLFIVNNRTSGVTVVVRYYT